MIGVSKTFGGSSILSSPALKNARKPCIYWVSGVFDFWSKSNLITNLIIGSNHLFSYGKFLKLYVGYFMYRIWFQRCSSIDLITVKYPKETDRYNIIVKKDKYAITINKAGVSAGMQAVVATVKKTGNVTVSYKKQGTVNKQTFVVKKYTNPLKSLKIDGTNIVSKFKTDNVYVLPYAKYAGKKIKVSYSAASNFELSYVDYLLQPGNMKSDMVKNKGTVKIQKKNSALLISAYNAKTQQNETCMVIFQ